MTNPPSRWHPSTLTSIQSLGAVLDSSGHPEEAEALLREALEKQRRLLGADHSSTLTTLGNLATLLIGQNKLTEAEPLCRETLERRRRVLGDTHTATLIANNVMGLVLIRQGRRDEGEPYWREAAAIGRRVLGSSHPETLVYIHNLAGLAVDQNKLGEAEQLYREVMESGGAAVGAAHPTVLSATRRLAALLLEQKRYAEVEEILAAAEPAVRKMSTGAGERNLGALLRDLAAARSWQDQFAGAEPGFIEAHAIFTRTRGATHAETRGCAQAVAEFYSRWDTVEPGKGHDARAAEWKTRAEEAAAPAAGVGKPWAGPIAAGD